MDAYWLSITTRNQLILSQDRRRPRNCSIRRGNAFGRVCLSVSEWMFDISRSNSRHRNFILAERNVFRISTLCLKKVPTFKLSVILPNLTDFQNFCTAGNPMKFATNTTQQYPPYLKHVATLPREIKYSNFLQIFSRYGRNANKLHFYHL